MFSSTSLLFLVCACALATGTTAQFDPPADKCTQVMTGSMIGIPLDLQTESLNPGHLNYQVPIPTVSKCLFGENGVYAKVCDTDVPPAAVFQDFNNLFVYRKGAAQFTGSVTVTVICKLIP